MKLPCDPQFETLEVKFGKALRTILRGDAKREVANLEERVLREQGRLLNGSEIYAWVVKQFNRDLKLARPQVLKELALVKPGTGKNALRSFKSRWDATVERLVSLGGTKDSDEEILYIYFKDQFVQSEDMADSVAKVRRSSTNSSVHSYQWMYNAVEARLETLRLEMQEAERIVAYKPDSINPITPGVETRKGTGKGKPNRDTSKEACQRMLKDGICNFKETCWYSHDTAVLDAAKKKLQCKSFCTFFKQGKCNKGDKCTFSHETSKQNGTEELSTVALGLVAQELPSPQEDLDPAKAADEADFEEFLQEMFSEREKWEKLNNELIAVMKAEGKEPPKDSLAYKMQSYSDAHARGSVAETSATACSGSKQKKTKKKKCKKRCR